MKTIKVVIFMSLGFLSLCAMENPRVSDEDITLKIQEVTEKIKEYKDKADQFFSSVTLKDTLTYYSVTDICRKQIYQTACIAMDKFIQFDKNKLSLAQELYTKYNLEQGLKVLAVISDAQSKIFMQSLEGKTIDDIEKSIYDFIMQRCPELTGTSLEPEFWENIFPELSLANAIGFVKQFDKLAKESIAIFQDLSTKEIGMSTKIFADLWQKKHLELEACINDWQYFNQADAETKDWLNIVTRKSPIVVHIMDFFIFLILPFKCESTFFWD